MAANSGILENDLIAQAVGWLGERLPSDWVVRSSNGAVEIRSENGSATLAIEAKRWFGPREVVGLFGAAGRTLRSSDPAVRTLVVAPWLSQRTRELLKREDVNYLDLTGNALVRLDSPALFIQADGAHRNPSPPPRPLANVRGPKAGRLVRTLVDVRPPYGVRELATATHLAPGYVSRLLDALDEETLVDRSPRGRVESVDVDGLVRRWTGHYDVFRSNDASTFLAPQGAATALSALAGLGDASRAAVTGSFAAIRYAQVAAPSLLAIYTESPNALAGALAAIPADSGANVAILRPFDPVVWERAEVEDGIRYVAPSQVAADCLTGNGRMPSEGEALLDWMTANEVSWRVASLPAASDGS